MVDKFNADEAEEKTKEDVELEMETGKKDEDVYSEQGREELVEDDEIGVAEEGFMEGESDQGKKAKCASCGKVLDSVEDTIEREADGMKQFFCSEECADNYKEK